MTDQCRAADYHLHTAFSDDSDTPMEEMVLRAIDQGLDEVCFTEHVDYGVKTDTNCNYPLYFNELERLQAKYGDRITIRRGAEFGVQLETVPQYEADFQDHSFDFIILSNHQINNQEFWNQRFQAGKSQEEFHAAYYRAIFCVMGRFRHYSVLGHLDMIKRYDQFGPYPDRKVLSLIRKILRRAIGEGKGIEVNTSSFRYGLPDLTPSREILELYRQLGGRILTIGSDAHSPAHLASHFPEVRAILKDIGFREFCTFEKMQPIFHPL